MLTLAEFNFPEGDTLALVIHAGTIGVVLLADGRAVQLHLHDAVYISDDELTKQLVPSRLNGREGEGDRVARLRGAEELGAQTVQALEPRPGV